MMVAVITESAKKVEKFQNTVDVFLTIEDENIFSMYSAVRCVNGLTEPSLVGLDFYDIKNILENGGKGFVAYGNAKEKTPIIDAMKSAINSMREILQHSKHILCCIFGCEEGISMIEVDEATIILQESAHPEAEIIWGVNVYSDKTDSNFSEVIIIATDL